MTFLSPSFIFVFLPVVMAIYAMTPKLRRVDLLPMISSVFFVCVNIHDLLSLLYYFGIATASAVALKIYKKTKKRRFLYALEILSIVAAVVALLYRFVFGSEAVYHAGLLMCIMAVISMCSDIVKNEGRVPDTVWEAMIYITFFPVMLAGPFVRYGDFIEKLDGVSFSMDNFLKGILRFFIGFIKCVSISALLGEVYADVMDYNGEFGLLVCLLIAAVCGIRIYTFFSGYSDMARGIALMIGIDIKKDFKDPFFSATPIDYIKRFFRSLSEFAKIYIVTPVDTLFGGVWYGRIVACAMAGCYYVFIVSPSPELALILFLPTAIISYFVMFSSRAKTSNAPLLLKIMSGVITFASMSILWLSISLGDFSLISNLAHEVSKNPIWYASHGVRGIISNSEYIVVPIVTALLIFVASRTLKLEDGGAEDEISVKALVIRALSMLVIAFMFIASVVVFLPQFPDIVSYANVLRFI